MTSQPRQSKSAIRRFVTSDLLAKAAFAISALLMAFGYGVATMKYEIFPHSLLTRAQNALDALRTVERDKVPPHFIRYLEPGDTAQIVKPAVSPNSDLILMTGGFYYRTDLCPKLGCMAWIMDRQGKVLHRWSYDPEKLFSAADFKDFVGFTAARNMYVQGTDLDPAGNLVVTFQGSNVFPYHVGIAKFAPDGRLLWKRIDHSHHWPTTGPDGRIYAPAAHIVPQGGNIDGLPRTPHCKGGAVYQEGVRVLSPEGKVLHEFWMSDVVAASDRKALTYTVRDDCDPFHVNGVDLVNGAMAQQLQAMGADDARPGDLAVSLRSSSSIVIMDQDTGRIKRVLYGAMVEQHSPATMPDGSLLVFDNVGASDASGARSRILKIKIFPLQFDQMFPKQGGDNPHLYAEAEGQVNVSPDGSRVLVAETLGGRLFEVDLGSGKVLWSYREVDDISAYLASAGEKASNKPALLQTQGAAYVTRANFDRMFGAK